MIDTIISSDNLKALRAIPAETPNIAALPVNGLEVMKTERA